MGQAFGGEHATHEGDLARHGLGDERAHELVVLSLRDDDEQRVGCERHGGEGARRAMQQRWLTEAAARLGDAMALAQLLERSRHH